MSDWDIPEEIKIELESAALGGDWPLVQLKKTEKKGFALSKDVGGLTLVAMWIRTDSFELMMEEE
tara:strand:+ start:180 stop:374 length:195 start_codon:yes stop_codon:yes gene_type:complete